MQVNVKEKSKELLKNVNNLTINTMAKDRQKKEKKKKKVNKSKKEMMKRKDMM